jgi:Fe-S-cluster containining protein
VRVTASDDNEALAAGGFSAWVTNMQGALRGEHGSDVPCGSCTACCTSSQFVHIEPDETDTLSHIPAELLFPAPRMPRGHVLMGYDERGHCPMLIDSKCSIYDYRPRTCRVYDCRVFPAAGVVIGDAEKALIDQQAHRWRFSYPTDADRTRHDAVRAAAAFLGEHAGVIFDGAPAPDATPLAVLAVELHDAFVGGQPEPHEIRVELSRRRGARSIS